MLLKGWNGKFLRINLSTQEIKIQKYNEKLALEFLGGRGFAVKILWDELDPGVDPLSSENKLIMATGPLTGALLPSSGKLIVAAKSPLTGGYGDGNIGTYAGIQLRKAGFDAVIFEGASDKPVYVYIEDDKVEIFPAEDLWGLGSFETQKTLEEKYGKNAGVLSIGQGGENKVLYAVIMSMEGRAGGRPGIGAVMGSKKLKAVVVKGSKKTPLADPDELKKLGREGYNEVKKKENYDFWIRQGTMGVHSWCQETSCLPSYNFREGRFDQAESINGDVMEEMKHDRIGCPLCNMRCGNRILDTEKRPVEMDYENVGMLGANIGMDDLREIGSLIWLADDYGIDTITLGGTIGFAMEASEKGLIDDKIEWGNFEKAQKLIEDIAYRRGLGNTMADGVERFSQKLGHGSHVWAIHSKGLVTSAYDCHCNPGMALAFGTSPVGAHHKDAWIIAWEMKIGRESYSRDKVDKIIEFQRIRGGIFEGVGTCRLPWIELGFEMDWYPKYLKAATGVSFTLDELYTIGDRIYALIRAFWVREFEGKWDRKMDSVPERWFEEPLKKGPLKGRKLDRDGYEKMLSWYYEARGWDERGIPTKKNLDKLALGYVAEELGKSVKLNR
ncbi:MAG: aldehyde ferredoxin oxidoreductase family protein [Candidatus Hodarchaeota archaeon]